MHTNLLCHIDNISQIITILKKNSQVKSKLPLLISLLINDKFVEHVKFVILSCIAVIAEMMPNEPFC